MIILEAFPFRAAQQILLLRNEKKIFSIWIENNLSVAELN